VLSAPEPGQSLVVGKFPEPSNPFIRDLIARLTTTQSTSSRGARSVLVFSHLISCWIVQAQTRIKRMQNLVLMNTLNSLAATGWLAIAVPHAGFHCGVKYAVQYAVYYAVFSVLAYCIVEANKSPYAGLAFIHTVHVLCLLLSISMQQVWCRHNVQPFCIYVNDIITHCSCAAQAMTSCPCCNASDAWSFRQSVTSRHTCNRGNIQLLVNAVDMLQLH